uniref:Uncharacterized protein n=1 Tax=Sarcophilus harrisii TaxID=9305 RepID=A0A7N4V3M6_SARHA
MNLSPPLRVGLPFLTSEHSGLNESWFEAPSDPGTKKGFGFGEFVILPQQSHSTFDSTSCSAGFGKSVPLQLLSFYKIGSKQANFDKENTYFENEEEDSSNVDLPYIPVENSPTPSNSIPSQQSDSDDDPLEVFMAEIEDQAKKCEEMQVVWESTQFSICRMYEGGSMWEQAKALQEGAD